MKNPQQNKEAQNVCPRSDVFLVLLIDELLTNLCVKHTLILNIPFLASVCVCLVTSCMSLVCRYCSGLYSLHLADVFLLVIEGEKQAFKKNPNSLVSLSHVSHFLLSLSRVLQNGMLMFLVASVDVEKAAVGMCFPNWHPQDKLNWSQLFCKTA